MKLLLNKFFFVLILLFLISCEKENEREPFNLYRNSQRQSNYEDFGRFWTGVALLEKVSCTDTSGFIVFPLTISGNKFLTATANGFIVCFEHMNLFWEYKLPQNEYVVSNIVATPAEDIIFISNAKNLYSISKEGRKNWMVALDDTSKFFTTLLATKAGVYFASSSGFLYRIDFSGKILWKVLLPLPTTNCFTEYKDGRIVVNLTNDRLGETDTVALLDTNGKFLWKRNFERIRLLRYPIVWKDKIFVIGYKEENGQLVGYLICLDANGNTVWAKDFGIIPRYLSISESGEIYLILYNLGVGETISKIYKLDTSGNVLNTQQITAIFYTPLFISQQIVGALGYVRGNPVMVFFGTDLTLWKTIDFYKYPSVLNIPAILEDCTMIFVSSYGNYFVRVDENPIIKLLPW
ncbi:MAG: hypothetical protein ACP5RR_00230 [Candidatus Kapaibacteriota bacterium]